MAPFFIVTCGTAIAALEKELFAADHYSRYLLVHGFGVQLAESLAAKMHDHIRRELGLGEERGKRFSPGYPGLARIGRPAEAGAPAERRAGSA